VTTQNLTLWGNYLVSAIRCGCEIFLWDYFKEWA